MQRVIGYMVAAMASVVGWKVGGLAGPIAGYFLAIIAAASALYGTRRWLATVIG